jgi:hypothetical protein
MIRRRPASRDSTRPRSTNRISRRVFFKEFPAHVIILKVTISHHRVTRHVPIAAWCAHAPQTWTKRFVLCAADHRLTMSLSCWPRWRVRAAVPGQQHRVPDQRPGRHQADKHTANTAALPSGQLSKSVAMPAACDLLTLPWHSRLGPFWLATCLNLAYSFYLKHRFDRRNGHCSRLCWGCRWRGSGRRGAFSPSVSSPMLALFLGFGKRRGADPAAGDASNRRPSSTSIT